MLTQAKLNVATYQTLSFVLMDGISIRESKALNIFGENSMWYQLEWTYRHPRKHSSASVFWNRKLYISLHLIFQLSTSSTSDPNGIKVSYMGLMYLLPMCWLYFIHSSTVITVSELVPNIRSFCRAHPFVADWPIKRYIIEKIFSAAILYVKVRWNKKLQM